MTASFRVASSSSAVLYCAVTALALSLAACEGEGDLERKVFMDRLGTDTVAVEVYTRGPDRFEGDVLIRSPITQVGHYAASLADDGTVERLEVAWRSPEENPEGARPLSVIYTIAGDSATIEFRAQDTSSATVAVPPGVIPIIGSPPWSYAAFEQATMQAIAAEGDTVPIHFLTPRGQVVSSRVTKLSPDTVTLDFFGYPVIAVVDEEGRVLRRSGRRTTIKTEGERVEDIDFSALAAEFASRDVGGEGMGIASPRDTVEATVGGARLQVSYGQPAMRGREIWGGLVPYGEVWRTGANAATHLTTDSDLEIGGTTVPAGQYTLYSVFAPDSAQLIINRQTGQWGTVYNEDQDLARVNLQSESLDEPVERFTINVESTDGGGRIELSWDRMRYFVPFTVR